MDKVERLAEARWKADWTTDEGEISAIAPPFCQSVKEHYVNDARKVFAALTAAGLEVNKSGTAARSEFLRGANIRHYSDNVGLIPQFTLVWPGRKGEKETLARLFSEQRTPSALTEGEG